MSRYARSWWSWRGKAALRLRRLQVLLRRQESGEPQARTSGISGGGVKPSAEETQTLCARRAAVARSDGSQPGVGVDFAHDAVGAGERSGCERNGCLHARVFGFGSGHQFCQPESDASAGADHRRARGAPEDSLRQWAGTHESSFSGVGDRAEDRMVHIQPGRPMQNAQVESFHGKLRDECLRVNWFGNLFEARRKIAAWRTEYNQERRTAV